MMFLEKRLCPSAKISHTVSCNISLYRDTKEVIYRYTQNVYCCMSNCYKKCSLGSFVSTARQVLNNMLKSSILVLESALLTNVKLYLSYIVYSPCLLCIVVVSK